MSQLERVEEERKSKKKRSSAGSSRSSAFITFHPTKEQKEVLKELPWGPLEALDNLAFWLERGHKFTLIQKPDNGSFCAMLRENTKNWQEALTLTCWHAQPERALVGLVWALENLYPEFPDVKERIVPVDDDW